MQQPCIICAQDSPHCFANVRHYLAQHSLMRRQIEDKFGIWHCATFSVHFLAAATSLFLSLSLYLSLRVSTTDTISWPDSLLEFRPSFLLIMMLIAPSSITTPAPGTVTTTTTTSEHDFDDNNCEGDGGCCCHYRCSSGSCSCSCCCCYCYCDDEQCFRVFLHDLTPATFCGFVFYPIQ